MAKHIRQMDDITNGERNGRYEIDFYSLPQLVRANEALTDKEISCSDKIWNIIKNAVETEPDIYEGKLRPAILRKTADASAIDSTNLYKWLDRYWRSGKIKNAFIPKYSNCSLKRQREKHLQEDQRCSPNEESIGKTLDDVDRRNFALAVKRYYLTQEKVSFKTVYEKLLQDFYTVKSTDATHQDVRLANSGVSYKDITTSFRAASDEKLSMAGDIDLQDNLIQFKSSFFKIRRESEWLLNYGMNMEYRAMLKTAT